MKENRCKVKARELTPLLSHIKWKAMNSGKNVKLKIKSSKQNRIT